MHTFPIIGINGVSGSGKDTAADFFVKKHGYVKIAFADEMKRIAKRIYPMMTVDHLWGPSAKRVEPLMTYPTEAKTFDNCLACTSPLFQGLVKDAGAWACPTHGKAQFYLTARFVLLQLNCLRTCYKDTNVDIVMRAIDDVRNGYSYDCLNGVLGPKLAVARGKGIVIPDVRWVLDNEGEHIRQAGGYLMRMKRDPSNSESYRKHESEVVAKQGDDSYFNFVADNREWPLDQLELFVDQVASAMSRGQP